MEQLLIRTSGAALIAAILIWAAFSYAQQPQPQQTPMEQALLGRLNQESNTLLICTANVIALQRDLAAVTKERDDLKAKQEPGK